MLLLCMSKRQISLADALGATPTITPINFFADGIADATPFLDNFKRLSANSKRKEAKFWDGLKSNRPINNMLIDQTDGDGIMYTFVELAWPKGKILFRVVLYTPQMFELLNQYQEGQVKFHCSLQELLLEAERIENTQHRKQQQAV